MYQSPSIVDMGSFAEMTQSTVTKVVGGVDIIHHANGTNTVDPGESYGSVS